MTKDEVVIMSDAGLRSIIATLNPDGCYGNAVVWAKETLDERGISYADCLSVEG